MVYGDKREVCFIYILSLPYLSMINALLETTVDIPDESNLDQK